MSLEKHTIEIQSFFKALQNELSNINYFSKINIGSDVRIEFTHYSSFNSWSHSVRLVATEDGAFFQTYRVDEVKTLTDMGYKYTSYAHNQCAYRIPLNQKFTILELLTTYDRFTLKSGF